MKKEIKLSDSIKETIEYNRKNSPNLNGVTFEHVQSFIRAYGLTYLPELRDLVKSLEDIENSYELMDSIMEEDAKLWKELADS